MLWNNQITFMDLQIWFPACFQMAQRVGRIHTYPFLRMKDLPCHRCHQLLRSTQNLASRPMCRTDTGHGEGNICCVWSFKWGRRKGLGPPPPPFPSPSVADKTRSSWAKHWVRRAGFLLVSHPVGLQKFLGSNQSFWGGNGSDGRWIAPNHTYYIMTRKQKQ